MSNVINVDFTNDDEGYILNPPNVDGVYVDQLAATIVGDDNCIVGLKEDGGITGQTMTVKDLNRFCLMWLCIFDESVIVKEEVE